MRIEAKYIVAIVISLIIGASILGYGYLDYKYKKEQLDQKMRTEKQARLDKETKQANLQACLDGLSERAKNSFRDKPNMSVEMIKMILDLQEKLRDECFKKYQ